MVARLGLGNMMFLNVPNAAPPGERSSPTTFHKSSNTKLPVPSPTKQTPPQLSSRRSSQDNRVSFDPRVRVRKIVHLNQYTDDEIDRTWYSEQESDQMKQDVRDAARLVEDGILIEDTDSICRRGVEAHAEGEARRRKKEKHTHREAILLEQALQKDEGSHDPEYIAEVSAHLSKAHCSIAREVALQDELEIMLQI